MPPALVDFLHEQVVALLRPSRLTDNLNLAVDDGDDRLDVEKSARKRDSLRDTPALFEVFERVEQRDEANFVALFLQRFGDGLRVHALVRALERVLGEDAEPIARALAVHNVDVVVLRRGDARALIRAGELRRERHNDRAVAHRRNVGEDRVECRGRRLTGRRQLVAFDKPL